MTKNNKGVLRIGTSGIVVPGSRQTFPAAFQSASRLHYYSSLFNTLEVNSTFKKLPRPSTLEKWSLDVGDAFQFTIKLSKEVTHAKQMDFDLGTIASFLSTINHIGDKKGCILVQFPGSITSQYSGKVEEALLTLQKLDHNK